MSKTFAQPLQFFGIEMPLHQPRVEKEGQANKS